MRILEVIKLASFFDSELRSAISNLLETPKGDEGEFLDRAIEVAEIVATKTDTEVDDDCVSKLKGLLSFPTSRAIILGMLQARAAGKDLSEVCGLEGLSGPELSEELGFGLCMSAEPTPEQKEAGCDPFTIAIGVFQVVRIVGPVLREWIKRRRGEDA